MPKLSQKAKLQRQEKQKQIILDHLLREIRYGEISQKSNGRKWKDLIGLIKLPKVKEYVKLEWKCFEKMIDLKNYEISILMDELQENEDYHMMSLQSHCKNVDKMIFTFKNELQALLDDHNLKMEKLIKQTLNDWSCQIKKDNEYDEDFRCLMYVNNRENIDYSKDLKAKYFEQLEGEITNHGKSLMEIIRCKENQHQKLWITKKLPFKENKFYEALLRQDEINQNSFKEKTDHFVDLIDSTKKMQAKYKKMFEKQDGILNDLKIESKLYHDVHFKLREKLSTDLKTDKWVRTLMIIGYVEVNDNLKEINRKGEKLVAMMQACRKLETEEELSLPYPANPFAKQSDTFRFFWQRVGVVDSKRYELNQEKRFLIDQNKELRELLHSSRINRCYY